MGPLRFGHDPPTERGSVVIQRWAPKVGIHLAGWDRVEYCRPTSRRLCSHEDHYQLLWEPIAEPQEVGEQTLPC
jgi:hypothetical protein